LVQVFVRTPGGPYPDAARYVTVDNIVVRKAIAAWASARL
jgi:hypothetical protein